MLDRVNAILESTGAQIVETHEDVVCEAISAVHDLQKELKVFILNHPEEFISESIEDTYKNIRVFTEVAVSQYVTEISNLYGNLIEAQTKAGEAGLAEYL